MTVWRWDLFCRVIDNHGDAGVCWRLAADLGARGQAVRLWIDDPAPLAWMAPQGAPGVQVRPWAEAEREAVAGEVVVEAFGCDPPDAFVARMAAAGSRWINLEYLSAEAYVERSHRLPSPQFSGPGAGLVKHFFYPGFTPATGGLLREPGLMAARAAFERDAWLATQGVTRAPGERVAFVFCYDDAPLPALLTALAGEPTLVLLAQGAAQRLAARSAWPAGMRGHALPWLPHPEFDRALWCADVALVRGEDSFVRAQWAGVPFVWQIYRQDDDAHQAKREAFLARHLDGAALDLAAAVGAFWRALDGGAAHLPPLPPLPAWRGLAEAWRERLLTQVDLTSQLIRFITETR